MATHETKMAPMVNPCHHLARTVRWLKARNALSSNPAAGRALALAPLNAPPPPPGICASVRSEEDLDLAAELISRAMLFLRAIAAASSGPEVLKTASTRVVSSETRTAVFSSLGRSRRSPDLSSPFLVSLKVPMANPATRAATLLSASHAASSMNGKLSAHASPAAAGWSAGAGTAEAAESAEAEAKRCSSSPCATKGSAPACRRISASSLGGWRCAGPRQLAMASRRASAWVVRASNHRQRSQADRTLNACTCRFKLWAPISLAMSLLGADPPRITARMRFTRMKDPTMTSETKYTAEAGLVASIVSYIMSTQDLGVQTPTHPKKTKMMIIIIIIIIK
mmetsp:Transcript_51445/g.117025  ORF Transcript_51445/g.117025 Transcript_51445/m.117025 type:complete len:339 (+) Transcript_51445:355-1371(+)